MTTSKITNGDRFIDWKTKINSNAVMQDTLDSSIGGLASQSSVGTLGSLTTTDKTNLVLAINEVDGHADTANAGIGTANTAIGTLASLTTTAKTNLVLAINEVDGHADTHGTSIGTLASLTTTAKTNLVESINELDGEHGVLSTLTTTVKTDFVSAINEMVTSIGSKSSKGMLYETVVTPPANASSTGTKGMVTFDSTYVYICTATNTWKRVAIATW